MSEDLAPLESFAASLVATMEPSARRSLARDIAKNLRTSQGKRIAAQQNPDGTDFAPRKPQLRHQTGKIRRTMFAKLRTFKYLKANSTPDEAIVRFTRDVERIARVHQLGLRDKVNRKTGLEADYPARRLLGLTAADETMIAEAVTAHLATGLK
ncbi:MAG TPA: phage virion morphogenesis protein [Rhodocyclaceae bacterium]|nr:phage virion morphogenesis protein [Rhodocyclaceae bacterium]